MQNPENAKALFVQRHALTGDIVEQLMTPPSYVAGDLAYLDHTRPAAVQLRPLLATERSPRSINRYPPGSMMLVYKSTTGSELRAIVNMPFAYRKNRSSSVDRAISKVEKFDPEHGLAFRMAALGTDPFVFFADGGEGVPNAW